MEIRRAVEKDIHFLAYFIRRVGYDSKEAERRAGRIGSHINSNGKLILVLEDDSQLLGYVGIKAIEENDNACEFVDLSTFADLMWIGIDSEFRHKGFGSKLILACDNVARKWGKVGIWLDCKGKVIPFYVSNGYHAQGSYFYKGEPRYVMVKKF